jgi:tRNA(Arg) A34 adenosine deaminase TadA
MSNFERLAPLRGTVYNANCTFFEFQYLPTEHDFAMMGIALGLAISAKNNGDSPVGAVLNTPFGNFASETYEHRNHDSEAHAEKIVYQKARQSSEEILQPTDEPFGLHLGECVLYSTAELCVGCSHLYDQVGAGMVFIATSRDDSPNFFRKKDINQRTIWEQSPRTLTVIEGLRRVEAKELLTQETKRHE